MADDEIILNWLVGGTQWNIREEPCVGRYIHYFGRWPAVISSFSSRPPISPQAERVFILGINRRCARLIIREFLPEP